MIWDKNRSVLTSKISPQLSFLGQKWFPPAHSPQSFTNWWLANIYRICDISNKGKLLSKSEIEQRFQVTLPWFQQHQVYHMFNAIILCDNQEVEQTLFESRLGMNINQIKGLVSMLYKFLNAKSWATLSSFQNLWNRECQLDSSINTWLRIWASSLI